MVLPFRCRHKGRKRRHERGAECGGRGWAVGRAAHSRTAKSCGPGAPMQALSPGEAESFAKATVANAGSPGRARISRKPLRGEGRLSPPVPVVHALFAQFFAREPRVQRPPGLPCALLLFEGDGRCKARASSVARTWTHVSPPSLRRMLFELATLNDVVPAKAGTPNHRP
jgi:hypothetical protein